MTLNLYLDKVANLRENFPLPVYDDGAIEENGTIRTVMFYCMALEMSGITEKTLDEFYIRMKIYDQCFGAIGMRMNGENVEHVSIPYEILQKLVGIQTNVSQETMTHFMAKIRRELTSDARRELLREKEQ